MSDEPGQRPEGALIEAATKRRGISVRKLAATAEISEGRWRQIVTGFQSIGGQRIPVVAPAATLARMARAVGVTSDELATADRSDAAQVLTGLTELLVPGSGTPTSDELRKIRDDTSLPSHIRRTAQAQLDALAALMEAVEDAQGSAERRSV